MTVKGPPGPDGKPLWVRKKQRKPLGLHPHEDTPAPTLNPAAKPEPAPTPIIRAASDPRHPGEVLQRDFMTPLSLSQNALARAISVPPRRINEIVHGNRAVTADTDLRLARYLGVTEGFFLSLQASYDLAERKREIAGELAGIERRG